ncbi:MAG: hypothetical protein J0L52_09375 [Caulobacterales bacterium]|nr:hypothetical protein [Caulobacterales bacterium]
MFGRGLMTRAAGLAGVVACIFVAVIALGFAIYAALELVLIPAGAAAVTAAIFAIAAGVAGLIIAGPREPEPVDEPAGLQDRVVALFSQRPILGTVAGLAAGFIFLRNPALATMVASIMSEGPPTGRRRR